MKKVILTFCLIITMSCCVYSQRPTFAQVLNAAQEGDVNAYRWLGLFYASGEGTNINYPEAIKWFKKAIENGFNEYSSIGDCYIGLNNYSEAISSYKKAIENGDKNAYYGLGNCYMGIENYTAAIECYKKVAYFDKHAYSYIAMCYNYLKNYSECINNYKMAIDNGDTSAYLMLGFVYGDIERYQDGIKYLKKAYEIETEERPRILSRLCLYYENIDSPIEAISWFNKAIEYDVTEGYNGLAHMYFYGKNLKKDVNEALKLISKALALDENNVFILDTKGEFLYKTGKIDAAKKIYNKILQIEPVHYKDNTSTFFELIKKSL